MYQLLNTIKTSLNDRAIINSDSKYMVIVLITALNLADLYINFFFIFQKINLIFYLKHQKHLIFKKNIEVKKQQLCMSMSFNVCCNIAILLTCVIQFLFPVSSLFVSSKNILFLPVSQHVHVLEIFNL